MTCDKPDTLTRTACVWRVILLLTYTRKQKPPQRGLFISLAADHPMAWKHGVIYVFQRNYWGETHHAPVFEKSKSGGQVGCILKSGPRIVQMRSVHLYWVLTLPRWKTPRITYYSWSHILAYRKFRQKGTIILPEFDKESVLIEMPVYKPFKS